MGRNDQMTRDRRIDFSCPEIRRDETPQAEQILKTAEWLREMEAIFGRPVPSPDEIWSNSHSIYIGVEPVATFKFYTAREHKHWQAREHRFSGHDVFHMDGTFWMRTRGHRNNMLCDMHAPLQRILARRVAS